MNAKPDVLRFPNPGSTTENFISVYRAALERLDGHVVNLDGIVKVVVAANLATSSGYIGEEAVTRSTREDRSRDPLYNQLKMYAELFRMLGWLHPTRESALNYTFTLLGKQLVAAGKNFGPLLEECLLGMVFPTPILAVKGDFDVRPFASLLRSMAALDGYLSRDEMIVGPLSAATDRGDAALANVVGEVIAARESKDVMQSVLDAVAANRKVQVNTLQNYTRWPIAMLRDLGWAEPTQVHFRSGQKYPVWRLTETGLAIVQRLRSALDFRVADVAALSFDEREALAIVSHYQMLKRAGFDTTPMEGRINAALSQIEPILGPVGTHDHNILFSPFQTLSLDEIEEVFSGRTSAPRIGRTVRNIGEKPAGRDDRSHLFVAPHLVQATHIKAEHAEAVRAELASLLEHHHTIEQAASAFVAAHANDTKTTFYPLVTHLFQLLGYPSEVSRAGVHYQRWDASVQINSDALPVEIKSPTEELNLSTKAVRQALENKIVILARGGLRTRRELTSLIVGYQLPNERGELSNLIDNIFAAYGMRLGVIDLRSLAHLALLNMIEGLTIHEEQLSQLQGLLDV